LVDLGLGRAMTRAIAEKVGAAREGEIPTVFWTSLAVMLLLGCVGSAAGMAATPWLVNERLSIPADLRHETLLAFFLLALILPVDMTRSSLGGALEAKGRFDLTSLIRVTIGSYSFAAPVAVLFFTHNLVAVVAVLLIGRLATWVVSFSLCLRVFPALRQGPRLERGVLGPLLKQGGWMNVAGLIYPLMVTLDRFVIGSLVSVTAVTYYATPYEMVAKLWVFPVAVAGVLFPAFSARHATDPSGTARLFSSGVRAVFLVITPAVLVVVTFAPDLLELWLGPEFAGSSARVLQILAIGVCVNCLSSVPFALVQGAGRSDWAAKLQLCELPIYVLSVWAMAHVAGIEGVAAVWAWRGIIDTVALFWMAGVLSRPTEAIVPIGALAATVSLLAAAVALSPADLAIKVPFAVVALTVSTGVGWRFVLGDAERTQLISAVTARMPMRFRGVGLKLLTVSGGVPR
jgi:O-antigen/teichoic acid export membrane protein